MIWILATRNPETSKYRTFTSPDLEWSNHLISKCFGHFRQAIIGPIFGILDVIPKPSQLVKALLDVRGIYNAMLIRNISISFWRLDLGSCILRSYNSMNAKQSCERTLSLLE